MRSNSVGGMSQSLNKDIMSPHASIGGSDGNLSRHLGSRSSLLGSRMSSRDSLPPKTEIPPDKQNKVPPDDPPRSTATADADLNAAKGDTPQRTARCGSPPKQASQASGDPKLGGVKDPKLDENELLKREVRMLIQDCDDFIEVNDDVRMTAVTVGIIHQEAKDLTAQLNTMIGRLHSAAVDDGLVHELMTWKMTLKQFVATALNKASFASQPPPQQHAPPPPQSREQRDASPGTMRLLESDLEYFMAKLRPNVMPDAAFGTSLSNSEIRELWEVTMPQVTRAVDECRRALKSYVGCPNYRKELAQEAQIRCQDASDWIADLTDRHRERRLHLDHNTKHREITFKVFKPGGDVSVYDFLKRFESWADEYLSEEAKADQLYHKYLDKTITESYAELTPLREDFQAMKEWLIKKFGSVVPMAHGVIKAICKLTVPKETQFQESAQYLRTVHKSLTNLAA